MNDEFVFHNNNSKLLDNFLNNDYPEISKAIKKEGYNLDFLEYDFFMKSTLKIILLVL